MSNNNTHVRLRVGDGSGLPAIIEGISPEVTLTEVAKGVRMDVTTKSGTKSALIRNGEPGADYILTEDDKEDIAARFNYIKQEAEAAAAAADTSASAAATSAEAASGSASAAAASEANAADSETAAAASQAAASASQTAAAGSASSAASSATAASGSATAAAGSAAAARTQANTARTQATNAASSATAAANSATAAAGSASTATNQATAAANSATAAAGSASAAAQSATDAQAAADELEDTIQDVADLETEVSNLKSALTNISGSESITATQKTGLYVSDGRYVGTEENSCIYVIDLTAVGSGKIISFDLSGNNRCRLLYSNTPASDAGYGTGGTYEDKGDSTTHVEIAYSTWSQYKSLIIGTNYNGTPYATISANSYSTLAMAFDEIDGIKATNISDSNLISGSASDNILNTSDVISNCRLSDDSPYFVSATGCVTSKAVLVKGKDKVTIRSNNTTSSIRWILFKTNPKQDATGYVGVSSGFTLNTTGVLTDYTIDVPSSAVYMFVCLKTPTGGNNWTNDTIAYGETGTNAQYKGGVLLGIFPQSGSTPLLIENSAADKGKYEIVKEYVANKTMYEYVPISVGSPNRITANEQYNRANFVFFSDSHIDSPAARATYSLENVKDLVEFVNDSRIGFDAIIHSGDVVTGGGVITQSTWINSMKPFFDVLKGSLKPVIFAIGNHDTNDWGNIPANAMDDTAWGTAWLDYAESYMGIVRQTKSNSHKSTWHYKDISDKKIRIISIDVQDTDKTKTDGSGNVLYYGGSAWYISQEQMDWIVGTALNFDDKDDPGWGVIMALHQTMKLSDAYYSTTVTPAYDSAIAKLVQVCKAFNTQGTYESSYDFATDSFYDLDINADFTRYASEDHKPYMICMLVGHEHFDKVKTVDGINMIWIANSSCTDAYSDSRIARIPKTSTQNLFNLVSVDTKERKIRVIRYGAGKNCFGVEPYSFMPGGLAF